MLHFRHVMAYLRLIQPYLFLFRTLTYLETFNFSHTQAYFKHHTQYLGRFKVTQNPRIIQAPYVSSLFQVAYSVIFTTLDIFMPIFPHSGIFWLIQVYSESWHNQTYSCIFRHIQNPWLIQIYSELLTYLANFRHYSRASHAYSEPYLSRFRHMQNSGLFRHVMFHAYSGIFTKSHITRHICPHQYSNIFRILALSVQVM